MDTNIPDKNSHGSAVPGPKPNLKSMLFFAVFVCLQPIVLFAAAGRLNWIMGWIYLILILLSNLISRTLVLRKFPDLLLERSQGLKAANIKAQDKPLVFLIGIIGPLLTIIIIGMDDRYDWSPALSFMLQGIALLIVIFGMILSTWAVITNQFFSSVVRIQEERSHSVVSSGPYQFVRHPGYTGGLLCYLAVPLMLDSLWGLLPAILTCLILVLRTILEDQTLHEELPGYPEYAKQTPYRLLPGIW